MQQGRKKVQKGISVVIGLLMVIAITAMIIFAGCSQNPINQETTVSYFDQPFDDSVFEADGLTASKLKGGLAGITSYNGEKLILAEEGGTVNINMTGMVSEFEVLPHAIPQDTVITVDVRQIFKYGRTVTLFDFGPDRLQFSTSSVLRIDKASLNVTGNNVNFYWLDPSSNLWILQGICYDGEDGAVDGVFEIPVDHFSKYGISG